MPAKPHAAPVPSGRASLLNPPHRLGLQPVTVPDFSVMEASVREQMRARHSLLAAQLEHRGTNPVELGTAYGELGELLMAATYFDAAEACYLNAEALAPADVRWPYYLGQLYKAKGPLAKSAASFEKARQLRPNDVATLVWLGEAYLLQGRSDAAEPLFGQALTLDSTSAAAHFGAGRAARSDEQFVRRGQSKWCPGCRCEYGLYSSNR